MLQIKVTGLKAAMSGLERELDQYEARVAEEIRKIAVSKTPIDKGRARRGWKIEKRFQGRSIVNRVPYIDLLEQGHSKKQAPNGIIGPTVREINRRKIR